MKDSTHYLLEPKIAKCEDPLYKLLILCFFILLQIVQVEQIKVVQMECKFTGVSLWGSMLQKWGDKYIAEREMTHRPYSVTKGHDQRHGH